MSRKDYAPNTPGSRRGTLNNTFFLETTKRPRPIDDYAKEIKRVYEKLTSEEVLSLLKTVKKGTFPKNTLVIRKAEFVRVQREDEKYIHVEAPESYLAKLKALLDKSSKSLLKNCSHSGRRLSVALSQGGIDFEVTNYVHTDRKNLYLKLRTPAALMAREQVVYASLPFVITKAKRYNKGDNLDELVGSGNIGLLNSIDKFDFKRGVRFLTCASYWINQAMFDWIKENSQEFKINQVANYKINFIGEVEEKMVEKSRIIPTDEELYLEIKEVEKERGKFKGTSVVTRRNVRTLRKIGAVENISLSSEEGLELQIPGQEKDPFDRLVENEIAIELLGKLDSRKIAILAQKLGLRNFGEKTIREIAHEHNLTGTRVRQLIQEGLDELKGMAG